MIIPWNSPNYKLKILRTGLDLLSFWLVCLFILSLLYLQHLAQCLVFVRFSINICCTSKLCYQQIWIHQKSMHPVHNINWFMGLNSQLPCILGWPFIHFLPVEHKQDYGVSFLGWNSRSRSPSFPMAGNKEVQGPKWFSSVQSLSRVRHCDPMNRTTPCLPVHHHLPEFT